MVPLKLAFGEHVFLDKVTITADDFYSHLERSPVHPTTSQPSVTEFRNLYSFLGSHYESVIAIHLSGRLSGTWNTSRVAAEQVADRRITVMDSRNLSGALGLIVLRAAEAIEAGTDHETLTRLLEEWIARTAIYVSVPSLKYMVRGGRVSPMKGKIANWLNLKPIVSLDREGRSMLYGKSFSQAGSQRKMLQLAADFQRRGAIWNYSVFHAHAAAQAHQCRLELEKLLGKPPAYVMDISPIIGLNAGSGAVAIALMQV